MKNINRPLIPRLILLALVVITFSLLNPSYRGWGNVYTVFESFAYIGLIALGLGIVMIAGELDLSVGSMAAVSGILAIQLIKWGIAVSVIVPTIIALVFGLSQGYIIGRLRMNSVVFTIGISIALRGLAYIISGEQSAVLPLESINVVDLVSFRIGIFSPFSIMTITIMILLYILMRFSRRGREIYAIGGGRSEALAAGVSPTKAMSIAFAICAGCAGLAGALVSLKSGSASPAAHSDIMLYAITGILIADFSISGGTGSIPGLFLGVITLISLTAGLSSLQIPKDIQNFAIGSLLVLVIIVDLLSRSEQFNAFIRSFRKPKVSQNSSKLSK